MKITQDKCTLLPTLSDLDLIIASLFIILASFNGKLADNWIEEVDRTECSWCSCYQVHNIIKINFLKQKQKSSSMQSSMGNFPCKSSTNYFANAFYFKSILRLAPFHIFILMLIVERIELHQLNFIMMSWLKQFVIFMCFGTFLKLIPSILVC